MIDAVDTARLGATLGGWYDGASNSEGRKHLRSRLNGLLIPLLPLASAEPDWLKGLEDRLASSSDDDFLSRLPALRGGFQSLAPADRTRLLEDRLAILEPGGPAATRTRPIGDPVLLAAAAAADRAGRAAIARLLPDYMVREIGRHDARPRPTGSVSHPARSRWQTVGGWCWEWKAAARLEVAVSHRRWINCMGPARERGASSRRICARGNRSCFAFGPRMDQGRGRSVRQRRV